MITIPINDLLNLGAVKGKCWGMDGVVYEHVSSVLILHNNPLFMRSLKQVSYRAANKPVKCYSI